MKVGLCRARITPIGGLEHPELNLVSHEVSVDEAAVVAKMIWVTRVTPEAESTVGNLHRHVVIDSMISA